MSIIGRDSERSTVLDLRSGALVVSGEPGIGKSVLLEQARQSHEGRVLRMVGNTREANLPFAGLHQLLRPVLHAVSGLPPRQATALFAAMGLDGPGPPDRLQVGLALLTVLSELTETSAVLVTADDAQWIDRESHDALTFAARRIDDEPLAVLLATRDAPHHDELPSLVLGPLDTRDAGAVLDSLPSPPVGKHRLRVLQEAAGNPLALIELARAEGTEPGPLPLPERLERVFAADLTALPEPSRHALLLAAADERVAHEHAAKLAPAESAGLVRLTGDGVEFRHPLVRSAIYHSAPRAMRLQAHRELAQRLADEPDRRAWHLAAAAAGTDETVAAALEGSAERARQRGGHSAAASAMERAAELSPDQRDHARRLAAAAGIAVYTGLPHWVRRLAEAAEGATDDPPVTSTASLRLGQVLTLTAEHHEALETLLRAAQEPTLTRDALASAAVATFYSGDEEQRAVVRARAGDDPWTLVVTGPAECRSELVGRLPALIDEAGDDPERLTSLGTMAWLLDETTLAVRVFDDALHRWRMRGGIPTGLGCSAGWAYLDNGQWAQARVTVSSTTSATAGLPHLDAAARSLEATALALTGESVRARAVATAGLSLVNPQHSRAVAARLRRALGVAAVADGDHFAAYAQVRQLFTAEGDPTHYAFSPAALAELAAAAVRSGHEWAATEIVERTMKQLDVEPSPRMHAVIQRALALLNPDNGDTHFEAALQDPAAEQWPFERAQVLLDYGEWLRRNRRITHARQTLHAALERFRRLGAKPWVERAHGELRAAGVEATTTEPDAVAALSPQQQHIVRLAARGLSNREIGERLFLSPRTVGSHLYRTFPKLGVTSRNQLRDLLDTAHPGTWRDVGEAGTDPKMEGEGAG